MARIMESAMDVIEAIKNRRAIREFTTQTVDPEAIRSLIAAAVQAPSAMNLQPWAFAVVSGRERLNSISDHAKAHLLKTIVEGSPLAPLRDRLDDPAFDIFYGAPLLIIICATSAETGSAEDCALAAQNLMLAAHATGLGTCWIGLARPWLNHTGAKTELGLPAHFVPVAPLIIGHPKGKPEVHPRRDPEIIWIAEA
jgi:nitroreductase